MFPSGTCGKLGRLYSGKIRTRKSRISYIPSLTLEPMSFMFDLSSGWWEVSCHGQSLLVAGPFPNSITWSSRILETDKFQRKPKNFHGIVFFSFRCSTSYSPCSSSFSPNFLPNISGLEKLTSLVKIPEVLRLASMLSKSAGKCCLVHYSVKRQLVCIWLGQ